MFTLREYVDGQIDDALRGTTLVTPPRIIKALELTCLFRNTQDPTGPTPPVPLTEIERATYNTCLKALADFVGGEHGFLDAPRPPRPIPKKFRARKPQPEAPEAPEVPDPFGPLGPFYNG
jgi:hypothetical protein